MTTKTDLLRLRRAIDDRIPAGGTDAQTDYTDEELSDYLVEFNGNINYTAAQIWLEKASASPSDGGIQSYTVAGESYTMSSKGDAHNHAMSMYKLYMSRASTSLILPAGPTEDSEPRRSHDISRLTQDQMGW